jgi:membrane fusion protein, copper/silver efflux system
VKKTFWGILLVLLVAAAYLAGRWSKPGAEAAKASNSGGRRILYYQDPMHPAYKSDKPGIAPDCGMQLEPVYADGDQGTQASDSPDPMPPGAAKVSPERQQIIGIKLATVERVAGIRTIRAVGRVVVDENRVYRLVSATEGWVRQLHGATTGSLVHEGDVLATYYSRDLVTYQQGFLNILASTGAPRYLGDQTGVSSQVRAGELSLLSFGMSEAQIRNLEKTRALAEEIELRAPATGFVLSRNIVPNLRFDRNAELYRIGDLSRVWIIVDAFERDVRHYHSGMPANLSLIGGSQKTLRAQVSDILPTFDIEKKTYKLRLEADNPGYVLRPDMIVEVETTVQLMPALVVPADAVVDAGLRQTVYVDLGNGIFEPRLVKTGWHERNQVEIVEGLKQGDRIVVSGNFLLDSESRMKAAEARSSSEPLKDPVCGMAVDISKAKPAGRIATYQGQSYYFCSDDCRQKFEARPEKYVKK